MVNYSEEVQSQILARIDNIKVLKPVKHSMIIAIRPGRDPRNLLDFQVGVLALILQHLTIQDLISISMVSRKSRSILNPLTTGYAIWKAGFDTERDLQSKIDLLKSIFKNELSTIPESSLWLKYRSWFGFPDPCEIGLSDREFFYRYFTDKCTYCDRDLEYKIWEWSGISFCSTCFKDRTSLVHKPYQQQSAMINNLFYTTKTQQKAYPQFGGGMKKSTAELSKWLAKEASIKDLLWKPMLINHLLATIPGTSRFVLLKCHSVVEAFDRHPGIDIDMDLLVLNVRKDLALLDKQKCALNFKMKILAGKPKNILKEEMVQSPTFIVASDSASDISSDQDYNKVLAKIIDEVLTRRKKAGIPGFFI